MAVNKVIYDGATLVDLTGDTVAADNLAAGVRATGADGKPVVGLLPKVTIDTELSTTSTNPVQNKTITAALSNLDIDIATNDEIDNALNVAGSGDLPTTGGIVPIAMGGTGATTTAGARTNLGVSATADFANVAFSGAYDDLTGKPAIPSRTSDLANNSGYITSSALSGYVKSVNGVTPDSNGNVSISVSGGGSSVIVDAELSSTSTNAVQNKTVYAAVDKKLDKTGIAAYATRDSSGNIITDTYAKKSEVSGVVKSVNNIAPDSNGNVNISVSGGTGGNITVDSALSSTSTNAIQNRVVQQEFTSVRAAIPTKVSQLTNDSGYLTQHQSLDGYVKTSGQNTWRAQQVLNLATLGYEQYTTPNRSTSSVSPSTSAASYYATGAFTLNLAALSALLGSNQSTVFTAYITAGGDYALSITNGGTIKYIGKASDVAITSAGLLLNIFMTKDSYGSLTSIVQASKLS